MKFATKNKIETNLERAQAMKLRQAPMLDGYFFTREECVQNLVANLVRTQHRKPPDFRLMFLETANACNLKCPMCYTDAIYAPNGLTPETPRLEFHEMKLATKAGREAGAATLAIAGRGEPLLDGNFWKIGEFAREQGMNLVAFVNGTLITPQVAKRLEKLCNAVVTKYFALNEQTNDILVGVKGEFVQMKEGLANLLEAGMRAPHLGIDVVITKQNREQLAEILRMCRNLSIIPYFERLWPIGRGKNMNGNTLLPAEEVNAIYQKLREIDEKEFGITWGFAPGMGILGNAETDKRMIAFQVDVFGNVRPGLGEKEIIANMRNQPQGIAGVLNGAGAWGRYYRQLANDLGLEAVYDEKQKGEQPNVHIEEAATPYHALLENAAKDLEAGVDKHATQCGCRFAQETRPAPEGVKEVIARMRQAIAGSDYEKAFNAMEKLVLNQNRYKQLIGQMLVEELVFGERHLQFCNRQDLQKFEWSEKGMDAHLANDPIHKAFGGKGRRALRGEGIYLCDDLAYGLLGYFLQHGFEHAAINAAVRVMVGKGEAHPGLGEITNFRNERLAQTFLDYLKKGAGKGMPAFLDDIYEHAAGWCCMPRNEAFLEAAKKHIAAELVRLRDDLAQVADPVDWLKQHCMCVFAGAEALATLASNFHRHADELSNPKLAQATEDILRMLARDDVLREKMHRKEGVPKIF